MNTGQKNQSSQSIGSLGRTIPGQIVLVLQGGGALGSYQAGVYQALHEAGIEPDWIIGTSIGAINASLIAGNAPQNRVQRLQEFWKRMEQRSIWSFPGAFPGFNDKLSYWSTVSNGIPGFFKPNPLGPDTDAQDQPPPFTHIRLAPHGQKPHLRRSGFGGFCCRNRRTHGAGRLTRFF
jgi:NTE family protein